MTTLTLLALLGADDAAACGGFGCNQSRPVLQNAERVVFGVNEAREEVEMHVQITYEGSAEDFAWIVPVPANPELMVSNSALFSRVARATQPVFALNVVEEGHCREPLDMGSVPLASAEYDVRSAIASSAGGSYGVEVVEQQAVGPYDTVTLRAESADALLSWLDDNGYEVPDTIDEALAPYVSRDAYFVALKLQKDKDTGDLVPLALRYDGRKAMVPVQLTSISATPDMRMEAYVLGEHRAVPESYLHVKINEAAVDWWNAGSNYTDVITEAADEAGGHAFATDYYGPTNIVQPIWVEAGFDEAALRETASLGGWVDMLQVAIRVPSPELYTFLEREFGFGTGNGQLAWSCPSCVGGNLSDPSAATDRLLAEIVRPLRSVQNLLDRSPKLTRMTSSLDAIEMTVDPVFVFNPDMHSEVRKRRTADLVYRCGNGRAQSHANRALVLDDGREIDIPSERWFELHGGSPMSYIADLGETKAQVIEQTGSEGKPSVLVDNTASFLELARVHNRLAGLGCDSTGLGVGASLAGLLGALAIRRRR